MKKENKKPRNEGRKFLTVTEVAELLRVHRRTVEKMIHEREISSCKPKGKRLIPKSEIESLISGSWTQARAVE